jgi:hypothetical protein
MVLEFLAREIRKEKKKPNSNKEGNSQINPYLQMIQPYT